MRTKNIDIGLKFKIIRNEIFGVVNYLRGRKAFLYFDNPFYFDNPSTLFTILLYPREINEMTKESIKGDVRTILDIGGNIGHFPITAANLYPDLDLIDIFEPNGAVFDMLNRNIKEYPYINSYKYGVGEEGRKDFYYVKNKSAMGSLIEEFSRNEGDKSESTEVTLVSNVSSLTGRREYDLIKIDVEGYELEVVKRIGNLKPKYLYIEMSAGVRRTYSSSEMYQAISDNWGNYRVLANSALVGGRVYYDTLIEFVDA